MDGGKKQEECGNYYWFLEIQLASKIPAVNSRWRNDEASQKTLLDLTFARAKIEITENVQEEYEKKAEEVELCS